MSTNFVVYEGDQYEGSSKESINMADSHAFGETICRHTLSTQELTRGYGAIANTASHFEVFRESFRAKQKDGLGRTGLLFLF